MAQVKAVPEGHKTVTPFLNINGAAEAIEFYKKAFGAEERGRMPGPNNTIMHAEIKIGDSYVMISDAMQQQPTHSSNHLYVDDVDTWWKRATAAGAKIEMPLADQFWGDRFGILSDKWGNRWSLATHKEDVSEPEMKKRAAEVARQMQQGKQS